MQKAFYWIVYLQLPICWVRSFGDVLFSLFSLFLGSFRTHFRTKFRWQIPVNPFWIGLNPLLTLFKAFKFSCRFSRDPSPWELSRRLGGVHPCFDATREHSKRPEARHMLLLWVTERPCRLCNRPCKRVNMGVRPFERRLLTGLKGLRGYSFWRCSWFLRFFP